MPYEEREEDDAAFDCVVVAVSDQLLLFCVGVENYKK
jgi:hypothetical protein